MSFFEYFLFLAPAMLFAGWAQLKVKSAYAQMSRVPARSSMSGAQAAHQILAANGLNNVGIEHAGGFLGDHYDPKKKVLRLSKDVYHGTSLASLGIAAHEAGHAIQDQQNYAPLVLRNGIVPLASLGSNASFALLFLGGLMNAGGLILLGIGLFSVVVIFQLINLPVEFDASNRAKEILVAKGMVAPDEEAGVSKVLDAAAMTYVAATLTAILTLLYYLVQFGLVGGRDD